MHTKYTKGAPETKTGISSKNSRRKKNPFQMEKPGVGIDTGKTETNRNKTKKNGFGFTYLNSENQKYRFSLGWFRF